MNISSFIAKRYIFAKKSRNVINVISFISFFGLLISSAALIIILSGFNGIQNFVENMYGIHAADLYITPKKGKLIGNENSIFDFLNNHVNENKHRKCIEETALLKYEDKWITAILKGVDSSHYNHRKLKSYIKEGKGDLFFNGMPSILLGYGLQTQLQIPVDLTFLNQIKVYGVSRKQKLSIQSNNGLKSEMLFLGGVFSFNPDIDNTTAFVDYSVLNQLFDFDNGATSLEINLLNKGDISKLKSDIVSSYNSEFEIKTHEEKNQLIYAANDTEKWMVFAVLLFILFLSSFNIMASITMLIIDKKKDIQTLVALGNPYRSIRNIFLKEGLIINLLGSISGLIIGLIICLLQSKFELLKIENAAIDHWPVFVKFTDVIMILSVLLISGIISAFLPSQMLMKRLIKADEFSKIQS